MKDRLSQEWKRIGSNEEYETKQYRDHLELAKLREDISYNRYLQNQSSEVGNHSYLSASPQRERLPKEFTGRDIIKKMQYNWYKDLMSSENKTAFQGTGNQIIKNRINLT